LTRRFDFGRPPTLVGQESFDLVLATFDAPFSLSGRILPPLDVVGIGHRKVA
jgi:hypothetical protein